MIKFSLLGETILEWNDKDIEHYHARRMAMDSMLCRFKDKHIYSSCGIYIIVYAAKLFAPGSTYTIDGYSHEEVVEAVTTGRWKQLGWELAL